MSCTSRRSTCQSRARSTSPTRPSSSPMSMPSAARSSAKMRIRAAFLIESFAGLVLAFVLWEVGVRLFAVPAFILPAPSAVLMEAGATWRILAQHTLVTVTGTIISLVAGAALGIVVGLAIGYSRTLSRLLYPLLGG